MDKSRVGIKRGKRQRSEPKVTIRRRAYRPYEVMEMYDISKATLYRWIKNGYFPEPANLGPRARGWFEETLKEWEQGLQHPKQVNQVGV